MLRGAVLAIAAGAAALGALALFTGLCPPGLVFGCWGLIIVLAILFERSRYKAMEPALPGPGWSATSERFIDEESGAAVTVYVNDAGERRYVRD